MRASAPAKVGADSAAVAAVVRAASEVGAALLLLAAAPTKELEEKGQTWTTRRTCW